MADHARRRFVGWLAIGAAAGAAPAAAAQTFDVLRRPSLVSAKSAGSAMLAIARAGKRLVAVGERGVVLLSDDDGSTWRQGRAAASATLTALHFA
ncbi:MAG TPA: glycosyl hydrolase, partial [Burkholderiaceae bacterium]|nr:glycosyl hydrolase [Burkholderiaceae bacterium]